MFTIQAYNKTNLGIEVKSCLPFGCCWQKTCFNKVHSQC